MEFNSNIAPIKHYNDLNEVYYVYNLMNFSDNSFNINFFIRQKKWDFKVKYKRKNNKNYSKFIYAGTLDDLLDYIYKLCFRNSYDASNPIIKNNILAYQYHKSTRNFCINSLRKPYTKIFIPDNYYYDMNSFYEVFTDKLVQVYKDIKDKIIQYNFENKDNDENNDDMIVDEFVAFLHNDREKYFGPSMRSNLIKKEV